MKNVTVLGIDLAKDVFQLHGVNAHGKKIFVSKMSRTKLPIFIAKLPACRIAMEACGSSNHWARKFMSHGHEVIQISPQHVKPFVQGNKNDKNDARAIAVAAQQSEMPTVPTKTLEQQAIQMIHRYRESLVQERTALGNRMRGFLREVGLFLPVGLSVVRQQVPFFLEDASNDLTGVMREILQDCHEKLLALDKQIDKYTLKLEECAAANALCKKMMQLPGVGPMTAGIVYTVLGNAHTFKNGRQFAAYLGLTPQEHSSGGKQRLGGITKRGNCYIRSLLVHGGRAVVRTAANKEKPVARWANRIRLERGYNKAAVAVANKNARHMWAMLAYGDKYVDHLHLCA